MRSVTSEIFKTVDGPAGAISDTNLVIKTHINVTDKVHEHVIKIIPHIVDHLRKN